MSVNNPPKLVGVILGMIIIGVLMFTHTIDQSGGMPLLALMVGYLVGNGVAAKRGDPVEAIITQRTTSSVVTTNQQPAAAVGGVFGPGTTQDIRDIPLGETK